MLSKKKLTEIFLRKEDRQETENAIPFDENYFELHCEFNGTNSSLISISATVLKGEKSKEKLNLKCKWYIKTADDFKEIPGINGNFYQPCLDDIGSIISVQIEPFMEDKQYEGITLMKEFGPIKLDPKLEQFQSTIGKSKMYNINLKLQNISSGDSKYSQLQFPMEGTIIIDESKLEYLSSNSVIFSSQLDDKISMESIRKTPNSLLLIIDKQSFRLTAQSSSKRDELMIAIRRFTTRTIPTESELNHLLRIQELIKTNNTTRRQLENIKIEHEYAVKSKSVLEQESVIFKGKLKDYDDLMETNNQLKAENARILGENSFYISEISIYKKVDKEKQQVNDELNEEIRLLNEKMESISQEMKCLQLKHEGEIMIFKEQAESFQRELIKQKHCKLQLENQMQERLEGYNRLQRKYNNLISDRTLMDETKSKKENQEREMEIQALKSQIFNLESLLAKQKNEEKQTTRIWDIKQLLNGLKSSKNNNQAVVYLQKLVGNLTETVTEKQLQLVNQKESNKILNQELLKYRNKYGVLEDKK